jgi:hypothetical protein
MRHQPLTVRGLKGFQQKQVSEKCLGPSRLGDYRRLSGGLSGRFETEPFLHDYRQLLLPLGAGAQVSETADEEHVKQDGENDCLGPALAGGAFEMIVVVHDGGFLVVS